MQRRPRPCLDCGALTRNPSRCDAHQAAWQARHDARRGSSTQRGYDSRWRRTAAAAVAAHRAQYGDWCPGWQVAAHPATDLTGDHITPKARGGTDDPDNVAVLCRSCNSRKHAAP
jgi:5-methylcytosine-specific restriction protein A